MTRRLLLLSAAALAPLAGCEWMKNGGLNRPDNHPGKHGRGEVRKVEPQELVNYLNERADRLQSITDAPVTVIARDRNMAVPVPITLRGHLNASQPRNFHMYGGAMLDGKIDLGSNDDQFWVYVKVPSNDPVYLYAAHADFQSGRAPIPGNIPFEPEWVMQAFGMAHFPPAPAGGAYSVKADERAGTYTLSWPAVTPNRVAVVKEVVFEAQTATGNRSQVKKHVVLDAKRNKPICSAEVREARTVQATDPRTGQPVAVQYPTRIFLRWEEQKFEMELDVQAATINQPLSPEEQRRHFTRPNIQGANAIDLATYSAPARP